MLEPSRQGIKNNIDVNTTQNVTKMSTNSETKIL